MNAPSDFLMDTNILSQLALRDPPGYLLRWLASGEIRNVVLPLGSLVELERGIAWLVADDSPVKAALLRNWLNNLLTSDIVWLEMTMEAARIYALMTTCMPLKHLWCPSPSTRRPGLGMDVLIAAQSIASGIPLATLNDKHFRLIDQYFPLPGIFNPSCDVWIPKAVPMHLAEAARPGIGTYREVD